MQVIVKKRGMQGATGASTSSWIVGFILTSSRMHTIASAVDVASPAVTPGSPKRHIRDDNKLKKIFCLGIETELPLIFFYSFGSKRVVRKHPSSFPCLKQASVATALSMESRP